MRVALVAFGFLEYSAWLGDALAPHARVTLFLPDVAEDPVTEHVGPAVDLRLYRQPRLRQPARHLRLAAGMVRQIRRLRADVVHVQAGNPYLNLLLPVLGDRALVVTCHDPRHHLGDRLSRTHPQSVQDYGLRRADAVIVHGESLRPALVDEVGVRPERIHVVPLHWRSARPDSLPARGARASHNGGSSVLFFGRIWPYKGLEYLIRAQPDLTARVPGARIVIAGRGEDLDRYRALMTDPQRFTIHDRFVSPDERDRLLDEASVVVLPYVEATQSAVVPLAWARARPVVASRVGSIPEVVDDGLTGLLVPPRDPSSLAKAIARVLLEPGLGAALGTAGYEKLTAELSPEVAAARTVEVYRAAISARGGRT